MPSQCWISFTDGKQLAEVRKRIPPEERRRLAKGAVAKREEYRRQRDS